MATVRSLIYIAMFLLAAPAGTALADKRVALVIGNNAYTGLAQLDNPVSDAKKIVAELKANGYQVLEAYDVTRERFLDTLERFSRDYASGADEAFVFYAGHGMTDDGRDILAPVDLQYDCNPQTGRPRVSRAVAWEEVELHLADVPNVVAVLDACRSTFKTCTRGAGEGFRGLSRSASPGRLIVNSTALGSVAADGAAGMGSPFANMLLKHLRSEPGAYYRDLFDEVARDVNVETGGSQIPAVLTQGGAPKICLSGICGMPAGGEHAANGVTAQALKALKNEVEELRRKQEAGMAAGAATQTQLFPTKVVATNPKNGAASVDPHLSKITVTFSRPVATHGWSFVTEGGDTYPETTGKPYFSDEKTCVLPVQLRPGKSYIVWINSQTHKSFRDSNGNPVEPYRIEFKTRQK